MLWSWFSLGYGSIIHLQKFGTFAASSFRGLYERETSNMKNENPLTKLMLLLAVLLTLSRAQAQADILRPVSIGFALTRTNGAAQQNQALAPSTPQASPQVQYMVIELGGRTALNISESGQIVGS